MADIDLKLGNIIESNILTIRNGLIKMKHLRNEGDDVWIKGVRDMLDSEYRQYFTIEQVTFALTAIRYQKNHEKH